MLTVNDHYYTTLKDRLEKARKPDSAVDDAHAYARASSTAEGWCPTAIGHHPYDSIQMHVQPAASCKARRAAPAPAAPAPDELEATWAKQLVDAADKYNWTSALGKTADGMKERTIDYFWSFCAHWRVATKSFIDQVLKSTVRELSELPAKLLQHSRNLEDEDITAAFASFAEIEDVRAQLNGELQRAEQAHRLLYVRGQLPPLEQAGGGAAASYGTEFDL